MNATNTEFIFDVFQDIELNKIILMLKQLPTDMQEYIKLHLACSDAKVSQEEAEIAAFIRDRNQRSHKYYEEDYSVATQTDKKRIDRRARRYITNA